MAWNGFPGSSTIATGRAAGCVHAAALIRADDFAQETADQMSENQMATTAHRLFSPRLSVAFTAHHEAAEPIPEPGRLGRDEPEGDDADDHRPDERNDLKRAPEVLFRR